MTGCTLHLAETGRPCGQEPARQYLNGVRCAQHTPAALAGQPEPPKGPGWPRTPGAPAPMSAGYQAIDARAIASGKRRSSTTEHQAAREIVQQQHERDRKGRS